MEPGRVEASAPTRRRWRKQNESYVPKFCHVERRPSDSMSNAANHNYSATCHPERSEVESKDPAALSNGYITGFLDSARNDVEENNSIHHIYVHIPFCARICPYCAFYKDLLDRSQ